MLTKRVAMKIALPALVLFLAFFASPAAFADTNACTASIAGSGGSQTITALDNSSAYSCYTITNNTSTTLCVAAQTGAMWSNFFGNAQASVTKTACALANGTCNNATGVCTSGVYVYNSSGSCHCGTVTNFECDGVNGGTSQTGCQFRDSCQPNGTLC